MLLDRISISIFHHDPIARAGLFAALGRFPDFTIVEQADEPQRWSPGAALTAPVDVAVADHAHGLELVADGRMPGSPRAMRVVVIADVAREWQIRSALGSGVQGYVLLGTPLDEIAGAIRNVHRGARHVGSQIAASLAESLSVESLTAREEEVLRLVVEGLCNKAISRRLDIAVGTVKSHLKSTFDKLNVTSRTQAVIAVERRGMLGAPPVRPPAPRMPEARHPRGMPPQGEPYARSAIAEACA